MTDQAITPEAGAQPQETTPEVDNPITLEQMQQDETKQEQEPTPEEPRAQKVVPLAALHEERQRVKELREKQRVMEERFNSFQQAVTQRLAPQQDPAAIPDVAVDPVAHFRARSEMLERQLQELSRPVQEMRQQGEQERQINALRQHVAVQEQQFAQATPDYMQALQHMQTASVQGFKALGYSESQAHSMVQNEYLKMAHRVASQGDNVAEHIYQLAVANGYQAKGEQMGAEAKLQNTQKVAGAARSLGSGGGVVNKLSLAALADMPADEFAKAVGDESSWRKMMGG